MAQTSCVIFTADDRQRLAAIIGDRSRPLKHVQRARIILHSGDRLPVLAVAKRAGASRPAVRRWQLRYAEEGIDGLPDLDYPFHDRDVTVCGRICMHRKKIDVNRPGFPGGRFV